MSFAGLLNTTCSIARPSGDRTGYGGSPSAKSTVVSSVRCRLVKSRGREATVMGETTIVGNALMLPTGTNIRGYDEVTIGSNVYRVLAVEDAAGHGHHLECPVELVQ